MNVNKRHASEILHSTRDISIIEYDPTVPCLIDTVTEFLYLEEFKQHMNKGLELAIEKKKIHGEIGWLANTKYIPVLTEEHSNWIFKDWMVRAADAGVQYIATILPDDEFVKMGNDFYDSDSVNPFADRLSIKYFDDLEMACDWLRQSVRGGAL
jgi:hypothetical protein